MLSLIAQVPASSALSLGNWLVDATCILLMAERAFSFWKNHLRETPPPSQTYMTKADCTAMHARQMDEAKGNTEWNKREHENIFSRMGGMERGIVSKMEARIQHVEDTNRESIQALQAKMDTMPDKIVAQLLNTRQLWKG
jgi:hypothetical protein